MSNPKTTCDECGAPAEPGRTCESCGAFVFDDDPLVEPAAGSPGIVPGSGGGVAPDPVDEPPPPSPGEAQRPQATAPFHRDPDDDPMRLAKRVIQIGALVLVGLFLLSWALKGRGPLGDAVHDALRQEPQQTETARKKFWFDYEGRSYEVEPVAAYEIAGLVVSHNDPDGFGDIYHDESSVDTKDLCVIWGGNVVTGEYRNVSFDSGSWTCWYRYSGDVQFSGRQLSNNHLITNDDAIRDAIEDVRIGDEVRIKGMLVNYRSTAPPTPWRNSSTVRNDSGDGACEVIFVEQIEVLSRGTPVWYATFGLAGWGVLLLLLARGGLFVYEAREESRRMSR